MFSYREANFAWEGSKKNHRAGLIGGDMDRVAVEELPILCKICEICERL